MTTSDDALAAVFHRNEFYRAGYRALILVALVQTVIILLMALGIGVTFNALQPRDRFFATTADGRLIKLEPLSRPNMTDEQLRGWSRVALERILTFGFHDYRMRLQDSRQFFTDAGFANVVDALKEARIIEALQQSQQVARAEVGRVQITNQGVWGNLWYWQIAVPVNWVFENNERLSPNPVTVKALIIRVSTLETANGIGIQQMVVSRPEAEGR